MPFAFNFTFAVPGIPNPFSAALYTDLNQGPQPCAASKSSHSAPTLTVNGHPVQGPSRLPKQNRRAPSPLPPAPTSRKRGWVPSSTEPSYASTVQTLSSGYLDTPAKYRDMATINNFGGQHIRDQDLDEMVGELPPPKRQKTLAGSIVSTALSAALIGTAVGLTVYRLWRDRGRQPELLPPPPYQESEWAHPQQDTPPSISVSTTSTPRARRHRTTTGRRSATTRHRKHISRAFPHTPSGSTSPSMSTIPSGTFDFRFGQQQDENGAEDEVEDQMDWIGDRISKLIEEGKKALGAEVVVMSDAKEDEVDDGSGAWEEEEPDQPGRFSQHKRARTPRHLALPPSYSPHRRSPSPLPSSPAFSILSSRPSILPGSNSPFTPHTTSAELESPPSGSGSWKESEEDWDSMEIKKSMERARASYLAKNCK